MKADKSRLIKIKTRKKQVISGAGDKRKKYPGLELKEKRTMLEKMSEMIAEQLNCDAAEINADTSFKDDLGADSLDIVELIMALEEAFDMEIPDADAEKVVTVGDVVDYIKENV